MHAFRAAHRGPRRDASKSISAISGDRVIASRRLMARAPIPETELRKAVNTDLVALFNTTNLEAIEDLSTAPEVAQIHPQLRVSRLSLGERSTRTKSSGVAREIETALRDFEPRLVARFDQGPPRRHGVAGRIEGEVSRQRRAQDAAGRGSGAIRRRGGARLRQDQARPALSDEPRIPEVLQSRARDPARAGGRIRARTIRASPSGSAGSSATPPTR